MAKVASQHATAVTLRALAHSAAASRRTAGRRARAQDQALIYALRLRPHSVRARMQHRQPMRGRSSAAASSSPSRFCLGDFFFREQPPQLLARKRCRRSSSRRARATGRVATRRAPRAPACASTWKEGEGEARRRHATCGISASPAATRARRGVSRRLSAPHRSALSPHLVLSSFTSCRALSCALPGAVVLHGRALHRVSLRAPLIVVVAVLGRCSCSWEARVGGRRQSAPYPTQIRPKSDPNPPQNTKPQIFPLAAAVLPPFCRRSAARTSTVCRGSASVCRARMRDGQVAMRAQQCGVEPKNGNRRPARTHRMHACVHACIDARTAAKGTRAQRAGCSTHTHYRTIGRRRLG